MAEAVMSPPISRRHGLGPAQRFQLRGIPVPSLSLPRRTSRHSEIQGDRFIPNRSAIDFDVARFNLIKEAKENNSSTLNVASPVKEEYKRKLAENFLHNTNALESSKILMFRNSTARNTENQLKELIFANLPENFMRKRQYRHIPQSPERILDAPELVDDYYLNLLDWSCKNVVSVALGSALYLWDAESGAIDQLMQTTEEDDYVTSVAWAGDGKHIAVGLNSREIQIWDVTKGAQLRRMEGHSARVGSLSWNAHILASGGRDGRIINHDVQARDHIISTLRGHNQEVCGLKWSLSGQQLASGGNDNFLHIWDAGSSHYIYRLSDHQAAVKALAWCPFQANLLASGGGTADRCIKLWNTQNGICLNSLDTQSQVCALLWSQHQKEILSSHGYSQNQLCVWKYPSMVKIAELTGHSSRVLHLAQSPDGNTVVSAAADETLRFWKVFGSPVSTASNATKMNKVVEAGRLSIRSIHIR